jgi:hypothetical protein
VSNNYYGTWRNVRHSLASPPMAEAGVNPFAWAATPGAVQQRALVRAQQQPQAGAAPPAAGFQWWWLAVAAGGAALAWYALR